MRRELNSINSRRIDLFLKQIKKQFHADHAPLQAVCRVSDEPIPFAEREDDPSEFKELKVGQKWGDAWQSAWIHITGSVPPEWKGKKVSLNANFNGEALIFSDSGCPLYGLTNQSVFSTTFVKDIYHLFDPCQGGETVDLWIEAAANSLFGIKRNSDAERMAPERHGSYTGSVVSMQLVQFNDDLWHLMLDMEVLYNLYSVLPKLSPRSNKILHALTHAIDAFADDTSNAAAAREVLRPVFSVEPNPADLNVNAVGHAHIDTGWYGRSAKLSGNQHVHLPARLT